MLMLFIIYDALILIRMERLHTFHVAITEFMLLLLKHQLTE